MKRALFAACAALALATGAQAADKTVGQLTGVSSVQDTDQLPLWRGTGPLQKFNASVLLTYLENGVAGLYLQKSNNLGDLANIVTARSNLGLGSAATYPTGTSGAAVCLLSSNCTWSASQVFQSTVDAATPNAGSTGGLRLRGNAASGKGFLQITDSTGATEWGNFTFQPNTGAPDTGPASWNGGAFSFPSGVIANVTGNVTGNVSGSSGSTTGNANTANHLLSAITIATSGDVACSSPSTFLAGNVTLTNCNLPSIVGANGVGGSWWQVPNFSWDAKGRITSVGVSNIPAAGVNSNGYASYASSGTALAGSDNTQALTAGSLGANAPGWQSCGTNCTAHVIQYPGGIVHIMGLYDCGSNSCLTNGTWVGVQSPVTVSGCDGIVATGYNPGQFASPAYGFEMVTSAYNSTINVRTVGFQSGSAHAIEGFSFVMTCHT